MERRCGGAFGVALRTLALMACLCAVTSGSSQAAGGSCPNEARRVEQGSTYLGACRAYELVSPSGARPEEAQAAVGGGAVAWTSHLPPNDAAGQTGGGVYVSRRGAGSWSTIGVTPPQSPEAAGNLNCKPSMFFSPSLARGVLSDGEASVSLAGNGEEACVAHNEPSLVSEPIGWQSEPEGFQNLFLAAIGEDGPAAWRLVNRTRAGVAPADATLEDASTDEHDELSHVVFDENAQLTEEAPPGNDLYEWFNGEVHLVTFLPDGQPTVGKLANGASSPEGAAAFTNAVSADGSRVFFMSEGSLYVRLHAEREPQLGALGAAECVSSEHACTIQVDASQAGGPGGGGTFLTANTVGTKVFFMDSPGAQLTSDTEAESGENLYEYEVTTGTLTDLTGGEVDANVLGYSGFGERPDGSNDLYFVAEGALGATGATVGRPNLYVADESGGKRQTHYIATLNAEDDARAWGTNKVVEGGASGLEVLISRVSSDGRLIAFTSTEAQAIAGYDNTPAQAACTEVENGSRSGLCPEIFLYEPGASKPTCVSCHWGSPPAGPNSLERPGTVQDRNGPGHLNKNVVNDGSVFFDSPDPLVPEDVNGVRDVYEFREGQVHLISSGTGTGALRFLDASPDGRDVLFTTSQRLLPGDASDAVSLYDARREGGFAEPAPPSECDGGGCRPSSPGASVFSTPASAAVVGSGNISPIPPLLPTPSKAKRPTRKQLLSRALKACKHRTNKRARTQCERQARRRYGPRKPAAHHTKPSTRGRGGAK
jgi:hypothetical protein